VVGKHGLADYVAVGNAMLGWKKRLETVLGTSLLEDGEALFFFIDLGGMKLGSEIDIQIFEFVDFGLLGIVNVLVLDFILRNSVL